MPTYAYACTECDHRFDIVQSFQDDALTECPVCAGRLRKLFNSVGVVFKGSGFYKTDSRSEGKSSSGATAAKSDSAGGSTSGSDSGSGSSSSSDSGSGSVPKESGSGAAGSSANGSAGSSSTTASSSSASSTAST